MTRIEMAPEVFDDFDRFFDYIAQVDAGSTPERIGGIVEAVQVSATSPMIGRPVKGGKRELVIGWASRGYVALYRYVGRLTQFLCWPCEASENQGTKANVDIE